MSAESFIMVHPKHVAEVGAAAAIVYARIMWRTERSGSWVATHQLIADETGLGVRAVRAATALLRERGWVDAVQGGGYDRTPAWTLISAGQAQVPESVTCMYPDPSHGSDGNAHIEVPDSAISSYKTVETTTDNPLLPPDMLPILTVVRADSGPDLAAEFDAFWEKYPRKVQKKAARAAWAKARRSTELEPIARGLLAQLPGMRDRQLTFVKYPASWLNGECWNDVPDHADPVARSRDVFGDPETVRGAEALLASWQRPTALTGARS